MLGGMVIKYFDEIPTDFSSAESGLLQAASDFGFTVLLTEAPNPLEYVGDIGQKQALLLRLARPTREGTLTRIPVSWEPQGGTRPFPTLTGELVLTGSAGDRSRLTLSIDHAPLAGAPDSVDKGMTYRVAWVTLNEIEGRIETALTRLREGRWRSRLAWTTAEAP
jgi:hypothetical protein